MYTILIALLLLSAVTLVAVLLLWRRNAAVDFGQRLDALDQALSQRFAAATADMASRLEQTKGDLRQQMTDRLAHGFGEIRNTVDEQLARDAASRRRA